ncbi:MAG: undecaprenyldiphospho-muramoylpentapeptide beta-N-acetylglucosaminyltransferase [Lachnospiraceae bacterium]|nr:undecaprenyldiphospho-muramoylpentapeptide beta-N-acetylglucosaminyltransferase [Lachnospiraceae bacterium]
MKKILLTGGGSAGHVTPNLALAAELMRRGYEILYVGSHEGIEKEMAREAGLRYRSVATGKLRRYLSLKNLTDPFRVLKGIGDAKRILKEEKPALIFSKGGFVSLPVVKAAKKLGIPVFLHESDMTPGLANKLCFKDADRIFCNFPETLEHLPKGRSRVSGSPIREELKQGSREAALKLTGFSGEKPVLLQIGGSLGAQALNEMLREALPELLPHFDIIHLCGKGKLDKAAARPGYVQFEFLSREMKDIFALADIAFSRAGANAICEFLFLKLPALLVPLPLSASRGDQILNARSFEKQGFARMKEQEELSSKNLVEELLELYRNRDRYREAMEASPQGGAVAYLCDCIEEALRHPERNQP